MSCAVAPVLGITAIFKIFTHVFEVLYLAFTPLRSGATIIGSQIASSLLADQTVLTIDLFNGLTQLVKGLTRHGNSNNAPCPWDLVRRSYDELGNSFYELVCVS